jgi:hypothetical protein
MSMLPWSDLLRAASQFGLTPSQFWTLSVLEWRSLMGEAQGLDRGRLSELCRDFPDDAPLSPS